MDAALPSPQVAADAHVAWLISEGWNLPRPEALLRALAERLVADGFPLYRVRLTIRILHPQVMGKSYTWTRGEDEVTVFAAPHAILQSEQYLNSPLAAIYDGAGGIRRRLDLDDAPLDYPILVDLKEAGATDYIALPFHFSDGSTHVVTLTSDRPGGFTTDELSALSRVLDVLARLLEVHAMKFMARSLLDTYLGRHSGDRVLRGLVKRGDGEDIHAVIWFCDLRESTPLADSMPRGDFLALLNQFFECMAGAVMDHGGEVLRFIGDAVLAIFPIEAPSVPKPMHCPLHRDACATALAAARDAMARVDALNTARRDNGDRPIGFGIALHLGDVTYGNIGTENRLEFSVIGPAANAAARLESMCKVLDRPLLFSADFVHALAEDCQSLGQHSLRGVAVPQEIFTLAS
ncbi:MAG: adenylate/guanylate cyclase domain-containing protein [Rhodobacterales bacterium]|nr:adenylate/guanylate cyclase domain-containing protein [Rhodobacterales bacterium]